MADRNGAPIAHDVAAVLADCGEDIAGHPVLKRFGLRLVGTHDELVEARFGDADGSHAALAGDFDTVSIFLRYTYGHAVGCIGQPEGLANVSRKEPWGVVDGDHADGVAFDRGRQRAATGLLSMGSSVGCVTVNHALWAQQGDAWQVPHSLFLGGRRLCRKRLEMFWGQFDGP